MSKNGFWVIKITVLVLFFISVFFLLICSYTTSPLYHGVGGDSAIFRIIGKYWSEGILPYAGLFDHKGPALFFINAVGCMIHDSRIGIFILQVIFLMTAEVFALKLFMQEFNWKTSVMVTALTIFCLITNFEGGNLSEEYALPFLFLSFYYLFTWSNQADGKVEHDWHGAIVYGVTFAFCLLSRVTNAVGICVGVVFVLIILIKNKKWQNILYNSAGFILGVLILAIPFFFYFFVHDAFGEMWYGTITYNFQYGANSAGEAGIGSLIDIAMIKSFWYAYGLLVTGVMMLIFSHGRKRVGMLWILVSFSSICIFVMGNGYLHYGIIALPYFSITLMELHRLFADRAEIKQKFFYFFIILSVLQGCVFGWKEVVPLFLNALCNDDSYWVQYYIGLYEQIPIEERDSFVAYNCPPELYLVLDAKPGYKYFVLQDWQGSKSEDLKEKIHATYANGEVKWIMLLGEGDENVIIDDILTDRYVLIAENEYYSLWRLR